jgi:hypothetical protein
VVVFPFRAFLVGLLFGWLFFVWLVVSPSFCLNQDLQDIRDFQDGRLICSGRFSGSGFFVWLVVWLVVFCLNQDLQDIRDFQDGRLMCSGRFSVSGFLGWLFIWLFVSPSFLSEPGFTGY